MRMQSRVSLWADDMSSSDILEPTIDYTPVTSAGGPSAVGVRPHTRLADGKSTLETELAEILRARLRTAAFVLTLGLGLFLLRVLLFVPIPTHIVMRVLVLLSTAACLWFLASRRQMSRTGLRLMEAIIVGGLAIQTIVFQITGMRSGDGWTGMVQTNSAMLFAFLTWIVVILIYGIFIPKTWQRAAWFVIPAAATPLLVVCGLAWFDTQVAARIDRQWFTAASLMAALAALASLTGANTVNSLRSAAYRARKFGQYRLLQLIGKGGMGEVYLAEHELLKRPSAIKLIRSGIAADEKAVARFEMEVQSTAELSHWNTVEIFDYGRTEDGTFYYVMEYLPGMTLQQIVQQYGPLPAARVVHFMQQICSALREAHAVGLIHRDIKPANIFAAERGGLRDVAKLLDFGLVQLSTAHSQGAGESVPTIAGSPPFMSPEQATGVARIDPRSDIYSVGATAFFLLSGRPPFRGATAEEVLRGHLQRPVPSLRSLVPDVPADLEMVILRCLEKEPGDRYTDADELLDAVTKCDCAGRWSVQSAANWWNQVAAAAPQHDGQQPRQGKGC